MMRPPSWFVLGAAPEVLNARLTKVERRILDGVGRGPLKPHAEGLNHVAVHHDTYVQWRTDCAQYVQARRARRQQIGREGESN